MFPSQRGDTPKCLAWAEVLFTEAPLDSLAVATDVLVQEQPHGWDHTAEIGAAEQQHAAAAISTWLAMIFFP